jgi:phage baseplate assembly protein W
MKSRKAFKTKDGDIQIERRNIALVEGKEEIEQSIKTRLETALHEWFLDPEWGLDQEPMKNKRYNLAEIQHAVIEAIHQDPRIIRTQINSIEVNNKRNLIMDIDIEVEKYGIINIRQGGE